MFGIKKLLKNLVSTDAPAPVGDSQKKLHTVKFDETRLTPKLKEQLKNYIATLELIEKKSEASVYSAALEALRRGRDANHLFTALMQIEGMQKGNASRITMLLLNRGTALMTLERYLSLGLTQATWVYAKAPCMHDFNNPSQADLKRDADHRKLDGKTFDIRTGVKVNGVYIWPSFEDGCKCTSKVVLPF